MRLAEEIRATCEMGGDWRTRGRRLENESESERKLGQHREIRDGDSESERLRAKD